MDRCSRPGGMDARKRCTVILETTTPRHFKRDWMVERLSPLARMFMIGSSYGISIGRFHCGLDLIDFLKASSWRPQPPFEIDVSITCMHPLEKRPKDLENRDLSLASFLRLKLAKAPAQINRLKTTWLFMEC